MRWADGGFGRHEVLATPEHPFYVDGAGWIAAAELRTGDLVPTADGGWLTVAGVDWVQETSTVYNLVVEGSHTFFVGEEGAWVHNSTGLPWDIVKKGPRVTEEMIREARTRP
ncbi:MAG: polymorphic toxin-type HINT domain-containing protein [Pseudomonadota bacterium]|nr:polymorphic toxin-type HINT domain-containing protein [Pseudomonadota bacterium]